MKALAAMGLASGGRLDNCILIDDEKVVNTQLRFPDEFARHKILDIMGDLYLLGRPLRGTHRRPQDRPQRQHRAAAQDPRDVRALS